jgi:hypothetical protein
MAPPKKPVRRVARAGDQPYKKLRRFKVIARVRVDSHSEIVVREDGRRLDVRVSQDVKDSGVMRVTSNGLTVGRSDLPALIQALRLALQTGGEQ